MIRSMTAADAPQVLEMMQTFYASDAVYTNGSDAVFARDVAACVGDNPFVEGFVFEHGGELQGYAMLAKSYSTEFGKPCIWIEDLYICPSARGQGLGKRFLAFVEQQFSGALLRLDVEHENTAAVELYRRCGFDFLPYAQMKKEI